MELKLKVSISEPGYGRSVLVNLCSLDNRVMRPSGKFDHNDVPLHHDISFHIDELAKDGCRPAMFESSEFLRQQMVERMSNHGHQHIEVHLDQDRRGKGIKTEELYRLGNAIFNSPPVGIAKDDGICRAVKIVGYQK